MAATSANPDAIVPVSTVTDGDAITSLGTSAAIAGQGAFATRSTVEDGFLAGNLATRLAPWTGGDAR
jgi:hypothetical protein